VTHNTNASSSGLLPFPSLPCPKLLVSSSQALHPLSSLVLPSSYFVPLVSLEL